MYSAQFMSTFSHLYWNWFCVLWHLSQLNFMSVNLDSLVVMELVNSSCVTKFSMANGFKRCGLINTSNYLRSGI